MEIISVVQQAKQISKLYECFMDWMVISSLVDDVEIRNTN